MLERVHTDVGQSQRQGQRHGQKQGQRDRDRKRCRRREKAPSLNCFTSDNNIATVWAKEFLKITSVTTNYLMLKKYTGNIHMHIMQNSRRRKFILTFSSPFRISKTGAKLKYMRVSEIFTISFLTVYQILKVSEIICDHSALSTLCRSNVRQMLSYRWS